MAALPSPMAALRLLRSSVLDSSLSPSSSLQAFLTTKPFPSSPWTKITPVVASSSFSSSSSSSFSAVVVEKESTTTSSDCLYGGKKIIRVDEPLYQYILSHTREPEVLAELREETSTMRGSQMQVSPEQGQFLAMLVKLMGAERCIEVGIFTGYSSLAVALALPEHGRLVACDRDKTSLDIARKYYERAGVSHKVDIYQGMGLDTLRKFLDKGEANSYDFTFLDADKRNYSDYYELLLQLVRPGGLVVIDNVLWHGKVADPQVCALCLIIACEDCQNSIKDLGRSFDLKYAVNDASTRHLRNLNSFIHQDIRVDSSMVPIGDGVTICRKR